jgi:hypothetical protein
MLRDLSASDLEPSKDWVRAVLSVQIRVAYLVKLHQGCQSTGLVGVRRLKGFRGSEEQRVALQGEPPDRNCS